MKATFLHSIHNKDNTTTLVYGYKGYEYMVVDYGWTGCSDSLRNQHLYEQSTIDKVIEERTSPKSQKEKPCNLNEVWGMYGWND